MLATPTFRLNNDQLTPSSINQNVGNQIVPATNAASKGSQPSAVETPVFLVGAERSGTTLLRLMLNQHPELAWCKEFEYAVDSLPQAGGWPDLTEYYRWLSTHRIFQDSGFTIDPQLGYPDLVKSFLAQGLRNQGKQIVGATVHRHFDRLLHLWPQARFIHIVRDGRDVARSCIGMGWAGNVWMGVKRWQEAEELWQQMKENLAPDRYVELTYEELIQNPVATLDRLCQFLGVPYDSSMLRYDEVSTYSKPNPNLVSQWRHKLSMWEIQLIESRIGDLLVDRGYRLSGWMRIEIDPATQLSLEIHDRATRLQFRFRRNGAALCIADYLSRKLNLDDWQNQLRLQINGIEAAHLK